MSTLASGAAQTPPPDPGATGQPPPPPSGADTPPPRTPEDLAAEAAADEADALAAAANGEAPPPRRRAAERIQETIAERDAAMEYANYWRDQALRIISPPAAGAAPPPAAAPAHVKPKLADFPTGTAGEYDAHKFADALADWTDKEIDARAAAREAKRDQATAVSTAQQTYNAKVAAFRTTVPDFDIVAQNPKLPISDRMVSAIMAADSGPQVYYHLAKNPAEAARIYRLPEAKQGEAIAKLEGKLEALATPPRAGGAPPPPPGAPPPRQQSRAPDPPNPTRAGGANDINLANCSLSEYLAQRLPAIANGAGKKR